MHSRFVFCSHHERNPNLAKFQKDLILLFILANLFSAGRSLGVALTVAWNILLGIFTTRPFKFLNQKLKLCSSFQWINLLDYRSDNLISGVIKFFFFPFWFVIGFLCFCLLPLCSLQSFCNFFLLGNVTQVSNWCSSDIWGVLMV